MPSGGRSLRRDPVSQPLPLDVVVAMSAQRRDRDRANADLDVVIARLASRQHGVVDRAQLRALGASRAAISHRLKHGRLLALHRGVYAVGHAAVTDLGRAIAALLAVGPGAVLSHRAAAWLWGLSAWAPPFVEITVVGRRPRSRPGIIVHEASALERTVHRGLPVTTPLQTLRQLPPHERERATSEALVRRLVTQLQADRLDPSAVVGPTRSELEHALLT